MYKYTFELILRITGDALQEIDDGLIQAGGERLKARMNSNNVIPTHTPPAGLTFVNPNSDEIEMKK
jgi:hypothetical protein